MLANLLKPAKSIQIDAQCTYQNNRESHNRMSNNNYYMVNFSLPVELAMSAMELKLDVICHR